MPNYDYKCTECRKKFVGRHCVVFEWLMRFEEKRAIALAELVGLVHNRNHFTHGDEFIEKLNILRI